MGEGDSGGSGESWIWDHDWLFADVLYFGLADGRYLDSAGGTMLSYHTHVDHSWLSCSRG